MRPTAASVGIPPAISPAPTSTVPGAAPAAPDVVEFAINSITPVSSRMFYFGYMFAAFPYAIGVAIILMVIGKMAQKQLGVKNKNMETIGETT